VRSLPVMSCPLDRRWATARMPPSIRLRKALDLCLASERKQPDDGREPMVIRLRTCPLGKVSASARQRTIRTPCMFG
jgi:hypothetical protein